MRCWLGEPLREWKIWYLSATSRPTILIFSLSAYESNAEVLLLMDRSKVALIDTGNTEHALSRAGKPRHYIKEKLII